MIMELKNGKKPVIDKSCHVAESSHISGSVTMKEKSSVWFNSVVRADVNYIEIGRYSNIQDGSVVHVTKYSPTIIGDYVSIGHGAMLHGCTVEDKVLIGIGAIVLDGAIIGKGSVIAAGALVPPKKVIPENSLVVGNPGKVVRQVTQEERELFDERNRLYAEEYPEQFRWENI